MTFEIKGVSVWVKEFDEILFAEVAGAAGLDLADDWAAVSFLNISKKEKVSQDESG
jgi:hypothetical protein